MDKFALIFKALSEKTRLRIINLLIRSGIELCVSEIIDSLDEAQYKISKHLKELKFVGLVEEKKKANGSIILWSLLRNSLRSFFLKRYLLFPSRLLPKMKQD